MGHDSSVLERRLVSLERKPIRLCWTICAAFAVPVLATALIEHDVLIALTARTIGATLVTADAGDFEAIRALRRFSLQVVPPVA